MDSVSKVVGEMGNIAKPPARKGLATMHMFRVTKARNKRQERATTTPACGSCASHPTAVRCIHNMQGQTNVTSQLQVSGCTASLRRWRASPSRVRCIRIVQGRINVMNLRQVSDFTTIANMGVTSSLQLETY